MIIPELDFLEQIAIIALIENAINDRNLNEETKI